MSAPTLAAALQGVLPSPTQGVWHLGPFPVRAYALIIIAGIVVAVWMGERRYVARGGEPGVVTDVAAWAVPFGIVGGRLYHVLTSWQLYFGADGDPLAALYIWKGGLGIWGAVALGALGAYIGARRRGVLMPPLADALAPGILAAQAIGRWGNWFNNELYGAATNLPWALRIYEWDNAAGRALLSPDGSPKVRGTYHPTFLYESLWSAAGVALLLWADRRFRLGHGKVFALYVVVYTSGRLWIEALRVDKANIVLGLRLNVWTSIVVLTVAVVALLVAIRRRPGRETRLTRGPQAPAEDVTPDDAKPDDAKPDDVKPDDVKPDDVKPDDVKPDDVKPDDVKPDDVKPDDVKPDDVKPDEPDDGTPDETPKATQSNDPAR